MLPKGDGGLLERVGRTACPSSPRSMSCARGLASARADARSRIGTSRQRQPLHKFLVVLFVSAAPIIHSEGPNADCFGGTVSSYTPSVCAEFNQPTCCESATLDEISSSLRRFRNALRCVRDLHGHSPRLRSCTRANRQALCRFPALTGSAVGTDGAPLAKEELCRSHRQHERRPGSHPIGSAVPSRAATLSSLAAPFSVSCFAAVAARPPTTARGT